MNSSPVIKSTVKLLIPFILVFGFYIIINGADSVGGGFQGGAVLASAFIIRWMVQPEENVRLIYMRIAERVLLIALLLLGALLLGGSMKMPFFWGRVWMTAVNLLIGVKVCCGLTVIFYRFVFFESR